MKKKKRIRKPIRPLQAMDLDGDGMKDWEDCVMDDASRQDYNPNVIVPSVRRGKKGPVLHKGIPVDDYMWTSEGYKPRYPNVAPKKRIKKWNKKPKWMKVF